MDLVFLKNNQVLTSSTTVAKTFNKRHDHLLRKLRTLKEQLPNFGEWFTETEEYELWGTGPRKVYYMNFDGFSYLVMGFTGKEAAKFKVEYIKEFNRMRDELMNRNRLMQQQPNQVLTTSESIKLLAQGHGELSDRITKLEQEQYIYPNEAQHLSQLVNRRVYTVMDEYFDSDRTHIKKIYASINKSIHQVFSVPNRNSIRHKDYAEAVTFIKSWQPTSVDVHTIKKELAKA